MEYSVKSICPQCKQEWSRDYTEHQLYHLSGGMLALEVCNECTVLDEHGDPIVTVELTKRYDCDKN